jgi:ABC-type lipoprotein release transport system permease subunit
MVTLQLLGLTNPQIRKIVCIQGFFITLIGLILGSIIGVVIAYLIQVESNILLGRAISFRIYWWMIVGVIPSGLITILTTIRVSISRYGSFNSPKYQL